MMAIVQPKLPPVEHFASLWRSRRIGEPGRRSLIKISDGHGRPVFCVHWGSGNVRFVRCTTENWAAGRPVFGFEAVGLRDTVRPLLSVDEMAERYLREMREEQPNGPYDLVGVCSGSQIAFEIARRLTEHGEKVGTLAVVNGMCPGVSMFGPRPELAAIFELRLESLCRNFHLDDLNPNVDKVLVELKERHWIDEKATTDDFYQHQLTWAANAYAQEHYPARSYDGLLHAFRSVRFQDAAPWNRVSQRVRNQILEAPNSISILRQPEFADIFE